MHQHQQRYNTDDENICQHLAVLEGRGILYCKLAYALDPTSVSVAPCIADPHCRIYQPKELCQNYKAYDAA